MSNKENKKISIIVPVYNEERLIGKSLPNICSLEVHKEVIVVDDGSQDNTAQLLADLNQHYDFKLIKQTPNQGKGAAVKRGLDNISGDYFIVCDADLEYSPENIIYLFEQALKFENERIAIFGSRFFHRRRLSFHYLVNRFLTELTNVLFRVRLTDMETCFKLIPASALSVFHLSGRRFEIEPEITAQLIKSGYIIKEFPISYTRRGYNEGKKITAKDGFLAIKTLISERLSR